jgi:hypothetical protein
LRGKPLTWATDENEGLAWEARKHAGFQHNAGGRGRWTTGCRAPHSLRTDQMRPPRPPVGE